MSVSVDYALTFIV